jgi:hypothetical protein
METLLAVVFAVVTGYAPFGAAVNQPEFWCQDGVKFEVAGADTWVIDKKYDQVIVKAGAGQYANTIYGSPSVGETVWADTDGDGLYNPEGPGDKAISHIIVCPVKPTSSPTPTPSPTSTPTTTPSPTATPEPSQSATPTPTQPPLTSESPAVSTPRELAGTGGELLGWFLVGFILVVAGAILRKVGNVGS